MKEEFNLIINKLESIEGKIENLEGEIKSLKTGQKDLKDKVEKIEDKVEKIELIDKKVDFLVEVLNNHVKATASQKFAVKSHEGQLLDLTSRIRELERTFVPGEV